MSSRRATALLVLLVAAVPLTGCTAPAPAPADPGSSAAAPSPAAAFGRTPTAPLGTKQAVALQRTLDGEVAGGYSDALATVITPDGVWSGASGIDGPRGRKAAPDDVVAIASVTKTFTAALVLKLAQQKRIDLDAPLSQYLDGKAAGRTNGATVRQALAMRSGVPDTTDASRKAAFAVPDHVSSINDIVAVMPDATTEPGTETVYSNPTYKLLGIAAQRVGGAPFADLVRTELVEPAHVPGTLVVQTPGTRTTGPWALPTVSGHWGVGGTLPYVADTSFSFGASDMAADTRSLATWAWALLAGRVVSRASLAAMTVNHGSEIGSGLDPYSGEFPSGSLGHQGGKEGYAAFFVAVPSARTVIVVAVNAEDAGVDAIAGDLLNALG